MKAWLTTKAVRTSHSVVEAACFLPAGDTILRIPTAARLVPSALALQITRRLPRTKSVDFPCDATVSLTRMTSARVVTLALARLGVASPANPWLHQWVKDLAESPPIQTFANMCDEQRERYVAGVHCIELIVGELADDIGSFSGLKPMPEEDTVFDAVRWAFGHCVTRTSIGCPMVVPALQCLPHSFTPNTTVQRVGCTTASHDHIVVKTTRPVRRGERFTAMYSPRVGVGALQQWQWLLRFGIVPEGMQTKPSPPPTTRRIVVPTGHASYKVVRRVPLLLPPTVAKPGRAATRRLVV